MGIVLTKYEDSANNNVVFDVSKFDYSFAEDAFPGDSQDDYSDILLEAGSDYTVTQQTTSEDSMGDVIDVVETSFTARAYLQHLDLKSSDLKGLGISVEGSIKGFFKHEYVIGNDTFVVKEGDVITDEDSKDWKIIKILGERNLSNDEILRVTILERIDNEGTP